MSLEAINAKLNRYRKRHYTRRLLIGSILSILFFGSLFIFLSALESHFWFSSSVRLFFLLTICLGFVFPFYKLILIPLLELWGLKKGLAPTQMAQQIGKYFPEINDKLLNLLELNELDHDQQSLISAAITQKETSLNVVEFSSAISLRLPRNYWVGLIAFVLILASFLVFIPETLSSSPARIVNFQQEYVKPAPFRFVVQNEELLAFKNEDFKLDVVIDGDDIPAEVYLIPESARKIRLQKNGNGYSHTFSNIQSSVAFKLEGAGFYSEQYQIALALRPEITGFEIDLDFPAYTRMKDQSIKNSGNVIVPEGTSVKWILQTLHTETAEIKFGENSYQLNKSADSFSHTQNISESTDYQIEISNSNGQNLSPINYRLDVIKDERPEISAEFIMDTVLFTSVLISGKISDDYGFNHLRIHSKQSNTGEVKSSKISIKPGLNEQGFIYKWEPNSDISAGTELWLTISDNDQVNGSKTTKSEIFYFKKPDSEQIEKLIADNSNQTKSTLEKAEKQSEKLNEQLDALENRLKNKKEMGWQEEKMIEDIIERKKELEKSIEELQKKHEKLLSAKNQFQDQSEKIKEKSEQLQSLMEELLDEETKSLYDELEKLLKEKSGMDEVNEQLSKIKPKENNLEQELDRALELFKHLKMEAQLEETANELEELADKQDQLSDKTEESKNQDSESLSQEQEEIKEAFEEIKEDLDEIQEMNQDLKNPEPLENFAQEEENIDQSLQELSEEMKNQSKKKTSEKQKNTANEMKQMAQKMRQMQSNMEMDAMTENMEQLQDILDNLIKLSFEEERIIKDLRGVSQTDPRFLELSQDQLRLVENSKIVEDSLISLASRVVQISNFITREIDQINRSLDLALNAIKERHKNNATSHQQFAMTSMNNLALLLDDVLQQMQMAMSEAMGNPKPGNKKGNQPSLSQLQQQLSEQIRELKKSGKQGRPLSEELAKMAAEQSRIRKELEALQEQLAGQKPGGKEGGEASEDGQSEKEGGTKGGDGLKEAIEKMEQNETDLVNKRLTENLIRRQEEIISRMLEAEKSLREQEQDNQRKGETATEIQRNQTPEFEEYLKARKSEIELLNTIPLDLNPFYKKEVNQYFRRLSTND